MATATVTEPDLGPAGALRWLWRQLTSMRTALILLFLLAVAAIPGSVFPQRGVAPIRVRQFLDANPTTGPWLDRFGFFDVYASPWFASIYLLLMISLAGCILPRIGKHWRTSRALPPAAPRNLARLPVHENRWVEDGAAKVVDRAASVLRSRRFRVVVSGDSVAAEKGYLRESGNLLFHVALLVLLVGVAVGGMFGYHGTVIVVEGEGFANTITQYDDFHPGKRFQPSQLAPFSFRLDDFDATFVSSGPRAGQPDSFNARVTYRADPTAAPSQYDIRVNHPLQVGGTKVFLLGHGYAPTFTVRDGNGDVAFSGSVPTLPQDAAFTSVGVVKAPDARPDQLGFNVRFTPTAPTVIDPAVGPASTFPEPGNPRVYLGAWSGDLGLDAGVPQSVYQLDTSAMKQLGKNDLGVGETWTLPKGAGSITFDGFVEYGNFQVADDPGRTIALAGAVLAILGVIVSLTVPRRRIWVRATPDDAGRTLLEVAGLARSESGSLQEEVAELAAALAAPTTDRPSHEGDPS
ncbi:MAG: cytochrome c biogenesis protein ResB [Actinomycetes bacterium]